MLALADENGNIVESYEYDAWGNVLSIKDGSGTVLSQSEIGNRYLWQGREYDSETGLYYFRARWYNPETGRWLSKDPIGIAGGLNLYVFCENNPVNFVDPMGLAWRSSVGAQIVLISGLFIGAGAQIGGPVGAGLILAGLAGVMVGGIYCIIEYWPNDKDKKDIDPDDGTEPSDWGLDDEDTPKRPEEPKKPEEPKPEPKDPPDPDPREGPKPDKKLG